MPLQDLQQLFAEAKKGDSLAFERLYHEFVTPVYRTIYVKVQNKDLADDLTQTVFIKALQTLEKHASGNVNPLTYFLSIARTTVIDHWRKKKELFVETPEETFEHLVSNQPNPHQSLIKNEEAEEILSAMKDLNDEQREVLTLKFINDQSTESIAEIIGKSQDAVRQIQSRAIKLLRKKLTPTN